VTAVTSLRKSGIALSFIFATVTSGRPRSAALPPNVTATIGRMGFKALSREALNVQIKSQIEKQLEKLYTMRCGLICR